MNGKWRLSTSFNVTPCPVSRMRKVRRSASDSSWSTSSVILPICVVVTAYWINSSKIRRKASRSPRRSSWALRWFLISSCSPLRLMAGRTSGTTSSINACTENSVDSPFQASFSSRLASWISSTIRTRTSAWFASFWLSGVLSAAALAANVFAGSFSALPIFCIKAARACWFFSYSRCACFSFLLTSTSRSWSRMIKICVLGEIWLRNSLISYSSLLMVAWMIPWCCSAMLVMFCRFKCGSRWSAILLLITVRFASWSCTSNPSGRRETISSLIARRTRSSLFAARFGATWVERTGRWRKVV